MDRGLAEETDRLPKVDRVEEMKTQDEPPVESMHAEATLAALCRIATEEADFQSALRGPIVVKEWDNFPVYYRRLDAERNSQIAKTYLSHGRQDYAVFAERALDADGNRYFPGNWAATYEIDLKRWNQEVISRVVSAMADGSQTQLTDEDLGKS